MIRATFVLLCITACDSKELYDAKIEKYNQMYCADAWPLDSRYPVPECEEQRGIDQSKVRY